MRVLDVNAFDKLRIGLATADDIRNWATGEVKKPETINYPETGERRPVRGKSRSPDLPATGNAPTTSISAAMRFENIIETLRLCLKSETVFVNDHMEDISNLPLRDPSSSLKVNQSPFEATCAGVAQVCGRSHLFATSAESHAASMNSVARIFRSLGQDSISDIAQPEAPRHEDRRAPEGQRLICISAGRRRKPGTRHRTAPNCATAPQRPICESVPVSAKQSSERACSNCPRALTAKWALWKIIYGVG